jgi:rod shape determining protein RodA
VTGPRRWRPLVGDPVLLGLAVALTVAGLAMIWSAGQLDVPSVATGIWKRQVLWACVALLTGYVFLRVPLRWVEWAAPGFYGLSLALLGAVLVVGTGPNESWLDLGVARLQPVEAAKLSTILMLARTLSGRAEEYSRLSRLWKPVLIVVVPLALVMLQPDLGSGLIFGAVLVAALYWAGVELGTIVMLLSPGVSLALGFSGVVWGAWFVLLALFLWIRRPWVGEAVSVLGANVAAGALTLPLWNHLAPYQQNRLMVFLSPEVDPQGAGWHLLQSRVAIGSGGWLGQGFGEGPQKRLAFLPEQHTDFIFSVVGEELGFVGVLAFLAGFVWFLNRVLRVARNAADDFGALVAFCFFGVWFTHIVVNVGMTVGLMPIAGLPLPFLSYGGSFLVTTFAGLGLVARVAIER